MAEKKLAKGVRCSKGNLYQFIPPIATGDEFGGIKANARTTETKEVVIDDTTGKLYVNDFEPVTNELQTGIDGLQNQIDNIVIEASENSDATAEVVQARVGADGTNHATLKDRLDSEYQYPYGSLEIEWTEGYFVIGINGELYEAAGLTASNFIDISQYAGSTIEICCRFASTAGWAFYDSEQKFISGANKNTEGASVSDYKTTVVVPAIAKYMRISGRVGYNNYYIKPTPSGSELFGMTKKTSIFSHKIAMFGDSITFGRDGDGEYSDVVEYTIPRIVGAMLGVECVNYGVGGMGWLPNDSLTTTAYDKLSSVDLTQFDTITLCYGVNDHKNTIGTWDSTDETTVMGQFNKCIGYIYEKNPTARVIVIAPFNGRNVGSFPEYWYGAGWGKIETQLQKACESYFIPFISQRTSPINSYTIQTLIGSDGVHPNAEGYKQIGEWIANEILSLTASGITNKQLSQEIEASASEIKSILKEYNAINLIPELDVAEYVKNGITMSAENGVYTVSGTAAYVWFYDIAGSTTSYPADFVEGETYHITFEPTDTGLYFRIIQFTDENPDGVDVILTNKSTTFTVPAGAKGLIVRLHLAKGRTIDSTVKPIVSKNLTNEQLEKKADTVNTAVSEIKSALREYGAINLIPELDITENVKSGITLSAENGTYTVSGTATSVWYYNIAGSTTSIPSDFVPGETYKLTYKPTDKYIYFRIIKFNDENPDGVDVILTNASATFTVPTDAKGLIVRLHVANGRTVDGVVKPLILKNLSNAQLEELMVGETPPAMLTIIDDDGHIGFMNDLLPIIESKHVPIATAITQMRIGAETKWMTWEQILDCYGRGAEVLCHTYDHDPNTPDKDIKQIEWEYTVARNEMYKRGLHDADILVYNNITGKSEKCQEAASKVFKCAIHSSGRVMNYAGAINPYYIQRIPVELDPYYYDIDQLKALIDDAIANGGWMIWIIHTSAEAWTTYNAAQAMADAIDYAIEQGLPIVSTDYGYRKYVARE